MPNLAVVLKDEIRRLAKKEVRAVAGPLRKRIAELERSGATYKRQLPGLLKTVARLEGEAKQRQLLGVRRGAEAPKGSRLGPRSIAAQRKRLKLTRKDFGLLAGVSANTIYLWENAEVAPKEKSRAVLVGLRKLGVKEVRQLIQAAAPKARKASSSPPKKQRKRPSLKKA